MIPDFLASAGGQDKTVKLWNVERGQELKTFKGHDSVVFAVAFSPDGKTIASASFDLVFSSLAMQWSNDLGVTLGEFARVGRPGTLLMFASFGPGTLQELAASWRDIDERHAHVHRFVDMHDVGDAMLRAGFADPVVDAETIRMEYQTFRRLLEDLREIGASNAETGRRRGLMTPGQLRRLEASYREHGFENERFIASYEVVYGHAWLPDAG